MSASGTPPVEQPHDEPQPWRLIWAVRAVPALMLLGALDLFYDDLPFWFLVLTLVRLGLGLLVLVGLRYGAREEWCLAYVVLVLGTSLMHPERAAALIAFSAAALVMTGVDLVRRRRTPAAVEDPA